MNPYAVANVAGILNTIATSSLILNISENPKLNGVTEKAIGTPVILRNDDVTNKTKIEQTNNVSTHAIEPRGMVVFGVNTTDAVRFKDSTPTKNQAANGRTFMKPLTPPMKYDDSKSRFPVVPGEGAFCVKFVNGSEPKQKTNKISNERTPTIDDICQKMDPPVISIPQATI